MKKLFPRALGALLLLFAACLFAAVFAACGGGNAPDEDEEQDLTYVKYRVAFFVDGDLYDEQYVYYRRTVTPPAEPSKPGYTFTGWSTWTGNPQMFDLSTPITSEISLFAQWEEKTVQVRTAKDLLQLQEDCVSDYELLNDIDFGGQLWEAPSSGFKGTFSGNGHTIRNIRFGSSFIGSMKQGSMIKDLSVEYTVTATDDEVSAVAGLVGNMENGCSLRNCSAEGTVTITPVEGNGGYGSLLIGGLVAYNHRGTIDYCAAKVSIDVHTDLNKRPVVGGLVGEHLGTISNSYAVGTIRAVTTNTLGNYVETWAGGLIGWDKSSRSSSSTITNCYADVDIVAEGGEECDAGGFIGRGWAASSAERATYINCFSLGNVSASTRFSGSIGVGAFCGSIGSYLQRQNCYASSDAVILRDGEPSQYGQGDTPRATLLSESFLYETLLFDEYIWKTVNGMPCLFWQNAPLQKDAA